MDVIRIAKDSWRMLWTHKRLWFFGFFVAAAGSGGGEVEGGASGSSHSGPMPGWVLPLLLGGLLVGLAVLVLHVVCEAALIDAVPRVRRGESHSIGGGIRTGLRHFWRMLGLKLLVGLVTVASVGLVVAPAVLGATGVLPLVAAVPVTIVLALVGVPWVLTVYFLYMYAMRFVVLDELPLRAAIRRSKAFLHGRIALSLKVLVADGVGRMLGGAVGGFAALLAGGLVGLVVFALAGLVPGLVAGGIAAAPIAVALGGALGTYQSSLWTLSFLEARG